MARVRRIVDDLPHGVLLQSETGFLVSTSEAYRSHRIVTIVMVGQRRTASLERGGKKRIPDRPRAVARGSPAVAFSSGLLDVTSQGILTDMTGSRSRWQDGRRAWMRLNGWHKRDAKAPVHPESGEAAIHALEDVRLVRGLLETAELVAVETARRHDQSWASIATAAGVTRQAAWKKWRDIDSSGDTS